MRILIIGKFPPIQGGVSAHTYWLARGLAREGHAVDVVTNARDVEATFRIHMEEDSDVGSLPDATSGQLRIHYTESLRAGSYIPYADPFVTKLFGLATRVIAEHRPDVIFCWYYEPYGFVGALLSTVTELPVVLRHAGSDLGRLSAHPDLRSAYKWMLGTASGLVVGHPEELENRLGPIDTRQIRVPRSALPDVFDPAVTALDVSTLSESAAPWFKASGLPRDLVDRVLASNSETPTTDIPTLVTYGKIGAAKGSLNLVAALAALARTGARFRFISASCGSQPLLQRYFSTILDDPDLSDRTLLLPPLPPWQIPALLAAADAAIFLEQDFPIRFHTPLSPLETLASSTCLVCSAEIAEKSMFGGNLVDGRNAVIVPDARDHDELVEKLRLTIDNREQTASMAAHGAKLYDFLAQDLVTHDESVRLLAYELSSVIQTTKS